MGIANTLLDSGRGDTKTIDGMVIGSNTPAAGHFTSVSATGTVTATGGVKVPSAGITTLSTTQTLAGATQLVNGLNQVNAASANDAGKLPPAVAGSVVDVVTVGSTATPQIFPGLSSDKIDGGTAGASVTLTALHRGATFRCVVAGNWISSLYGAVAS